VVARLVGALALGIAVRSSAVLALVIIGNIAAAAMLVMVSLSVSAVAFARFLLLHS
jgi:hypothetical protein